MTNYPEAVAKIVNDYLERVKLQLRLVPARDQEDFLREIQSHVYEAYQQTPGDDEVARILAVLRNLGEPAEVVADRLPGAMVGTGAKRNLPLYIVGGVFIALFGLPLGFGGVGVLIGLLGALVGVLVAYYATAGSLLLSGGAIILSGLIRLLLPGLWDKLEGLGVLNVSGPVGEFLDHFSTADQGLMMVLSGAVLAVTGLGMLWLGRYLLRGLRFLFRLVFDWMRRFAQTVRRRLRQDPREGRAPLPGCGAPADPNYSRSL